MGTIVFSTARLFIGSPNGSLVLFRTLFSNWVPFWPSFFRKTPEKFKNYISLHSERAEGELRGRVVRDEALRPTGTPPSRCFFREEEFFICNIKESKRDHFSREGDQMRIF